MRTALSILLAATLQGQEPKPAPTRLAPALTTTLESRPGLVYARHGHRELQLDLFRPKSATHPLPAIICIHGGGWFKGDRSSMTNLAQALAAKGYVTAAISYRLSGEAKFPAAIEDCKAAVRFLRANAGTFGIQGDAIGVTGLSAGGHLAALLATSGGVKELEGAGGHADQSSAVQACMAMGAQSDLQSSRIGELSSKPGDPFYRTFLGDSQAALPQLYALASPRHHLDKSDPPLAFMAGELDDPSTHADEMRHDMMKLGIPGGWTTIPRAPHAFLGQQKAFDHCVITCDAFFTLHLGQHGRPPVQCGVRGIFANDPSWQLIGSGYAGCEGAQWIGDTLHFAAHHDHLAFTWNSEQGLHVWRADSPEATSFRPDGGGGFYVVEQTHRRLTHWNAQAQMTAVLADKFEGRRLNRPNDVIIKSDGTLWFTDPDFLFKQRPQDIKELDGQYVYRLDPKTQQLTAVVRDADLTLPNGIAFSPDEKWLFVTDSGSDKLYRWPVNPDGTLGAHAVFATFSEKGLDGLAFDPAGRLWCCTRDGIRILSQDGRKQGLLQTPGKPTSISFGTHGRLCVTVRDACFLTQTQFSPP